MINKEELQLVMKEIETHPESWRQDRWAVQTACGTKCCFAGRTVVRAGYALSWRYEEDEQPDAVECLYEDGPVDESRRYYIQDAAADILGLDWLQSQRLFAPHNSMEDLHRIVDELCDSEEE